MITSIKRKQGTKKRREDNEDFGKKGFGPRCTAGMGGQGFTISKEAAANYEASEDLEFNKSIRSHDVSN
ncbi:hypothetical protein CCACVL1_03496 [Corchorus capsularis]|uniref:Uncharacterized protein n=1 Tax=Corchorus capsularis TaxID=210143 RepID=A0A1R3JYW9_COCAP|nr:hypothetical protein CCACVL1_03496 [Corchorus capsularis]